MLISNVSTCSQCGNVLKYYDSVRRIVRVRGGKKHFITVKRFRCSKCHTIHRNLPYFLLPYKQYDARIIYTALSNKNFSMELAYEDYPCEETVKRWARKIHSPL